MTLIDRVGARLLQYITTMRLSRAVSDINGNFGRKAKISPPMYLTPPLRVLHFEVCKRVWARETRENIISDGKTTLNIYNRSTQYQH